MRSKQNVPVGQGCKRMGVKVKQFGTDCGTRCRCHPDLFLGFCTQCGEFYHTSMPQTKTCSDKCRKRLQRSKQDKLFQMVMAFANGNA